MRFYGQTPRVIGVVFLEGNDEIRIDQDATGCQESAHLTVGCFEGVNPAEVVKGLEGEDRIEGTEPAGPGGVLQVCADQACVPVAGRCKQFPTMLNERRLDFYARVFDGPGWFLPGLVGQRTQHGLGESARANPQFQQADRREMIAPGRFRLVTFVFAPIIPPPDKRPHDTIRHRRALGPSLV